MKTPSWFWTKSRPLSERPAVSAVSRRVGSVLRLLFLLALCLFAVWRIMLHRDVQRNLGRLRAAGLPCSGDELNAWRRPLTDAENGAILLAQAQALMVTLPGARSNEIDAATLLSRTNVWTAATRRSVEEYLQMNERALTRTREALQLTQFRFPADYSYGLGQEFPQVHYPKDLARVVALRGALAAQTTNTNANTDGDADAWTEDAELLVRLAHSLDNEPTLLSYLVHNAILRMSVALTERNLSRAAPGAEACRRLQTAFVRAARTNSLPLALIGERAMMIPYFRFSREEFQALSQSTESTGAPQKAQRFAGKPNPFLWLSGFLERDLNFFLETTENLGSMVVLPPPRSLAVTNYFETAMRVSNRRFYFFSGLFLPSYSKVALGEASVRSRIALAGTALAVERFERERGRFPETLAELTPGFLDEVPLDPFTGAPLRYRRLPRGYILYSVDADGHDDGGREPPQRKRTTDSNSYDITFIVER